MPPQANATVTLATGAGVADDWDRPADAGDPKWSGSVRAYYREKVDRIASAGAVNVLVRRTLWLDTADVDAMALDTDDVLTFTVDGAAAASTGTAKTLARARLAGIPSSLQTTRIDLEDA